MDKEQLTVVRNLLYRRLMGDELTAEETALLEAWERQHPANAQTARRIASREFVDQAMKPGDPREALQSWSRMRHRMGYRKSLLGKRFLRWTAAVAAAAVVAGAIVVGLRPQEESCTMPAGTEKAFVYTATGKRVEVTDIYAYRRLYESQRQQGGKSTTLLSPNLHHTVEVPRGGEFRLTLDDGTAIHLNAQSSLTVPTDFSAHNRSVNLAGEAYFHVKSDAQHPFTVQTSRADVRVVGTSFNVKNYADDACLAVTLEQGRVEVTSPSQLVTLQPGEQALVFDDGRIQRRAVDTYPYCAWNESRIVYDNTPLVDILADLGRWYDFEAAFSSDRLRNLRVSMDIEKQTDFTQIAELLERLDKVKIEITPNKVIVRDR